MEIETRVKILAQRDRLLTDGQPEQLGHTLPAVHDYVEEAVRWLGSAVVAGDASELEAGIMALEDACTLLQEKRRKSRTDLGAGAFLRDIAERLAALQ